MLWWRNDCRTETNTSSGDNDSASSYLKSRSHSPYVSSTTLDRNNSELTAASIVRSKIDEFRGKVTLETWFLVIIEKVMAQQAMYDKNRAVINQSG